MIFSAVFCVQIAHARNDAESLVHNTEKSVNEHKMKIPAEVQNEIRDAIKELQVIPREKRLFPFWIRFRGLRIRHGWFFVWPADGQIILSPPLPLR